MAQIAELNDTILREEEGANYLYRKDEYNGEDEETAAAENDTASVPEEKPAPKTEEGYELPEFLDGEENIIKIK